MFDHVSIGVADIARSKKFYDAALKPLGFSLLSDGESSLGYGEKAVQLWLGATKKPVKADMESGPALLLPRQGPRRGRCLPCRRAEGRRQGQRQARRARRLRAEILRRVCHRSRRLSHRGLLRRIGSRGRPRATVALACRCDPCTMSVMDLSLDRSGRSRRSIVRMSVSRSRPIGLQEWYRSDCFRRVAEFYAGYPERSIFADNGRALMHHLIVMLRPERLLEIGTMYAGTTEVLARAVWEAGRGHVETLDPYGAERCPALIAEFLPELRERVTFRPRSSAIHLDQTIAGAGFYDFVLIDGSHELEFAAFDLECSARVMRPNGIIVLDNIEQVGPRFATKQFMERHPEWIDVAGVVGKVDAERPLARPMPSFPDCFNFLLQAPPYYVVDDVPRSFGAQPVDGGEVKGIELDLAAPADGVLHVQAIVRTFGVHADRRAERNGGAPRCAPARDRSRCRCPGLSNPRISDRDGIDRQVEITARLHRRYAQAHGAPVFLSGAAAVTLAPDASRTQSWEDDDARRSGGNGGREGCGLRHPDPGVQRRPREPLDVARAQGLHRGLPALCQGVRRGGLREGQRAARRLGRRRALAAAGNASRRGSAQRLDDANGRCGDRRRRPAAHAADGEPSPEGAALVPAACSASTRRTRTRASAARCCATSPTAAIATACSPISNRPIRGTSRCTSGMASRSWAAPSPAARR